MSSAEIVVAFGQPKSKSSAENGRLFFYFFLAHVASEEAEWHSLYRIQSDLQNDKVIDW
jgi:hypothetical protein